MGNILTEWLEDRFSEVTPREFYRGIFPAGELDKADAFTPGKYTGIIVAVSAAKKYNGKHKVFRYSLTDELDAIDTAVNSDDFCLCSPLSYAGKQRTAERARMLYAIAVDVDKIRITEDAETGEKKPMGLMNLWRQVTTYAPLIKRNYLPRPTYIVSSGTGLHLYYVLENPLPLYPDIAFELQEYKRELTRQIWNDTIVDIKDVSEVQQEGIYQGFRMPGTITKNGSRARAFKTGERVTMEYLNTFVNDIDRAKKAAAHKRKTAKLSEAAEKWPDWYERRIVQKQRRGVWHVNRALYDWWLRQIRAGATVGHRYYCLMMLAMYAQKCGFYDEKHNQNPVTLEELEADAYGLIDFMETKTESEDNHFTAADVQDALEAYQERWITYPRRVIEYRSGISIPENKRNGQNQSDHLEEARAIRDIRSQRRGERWDANNGRKSAAGTVAEWKMLHVEGKKADCIADTGLARSTVFKYWNSSAEAAADAGERAAAAGTDHGGSGRTLRDIEQRIKAEIAKQREALKAYEKSVEELRGALAAMPEGAEKEKYRRLLADAEADLAAHMADLPGSGKE